MLRLSHLTGFGKYTAPPAPTITTPIFCCGYECGQLGSVGQHWTSGTGISISTGTVRNGSRSLRVNPSGSSAVTTCVQSAVTVSVIRFYLHFTTLPTADTYIVATGSGAARIGMGFRQSTSKIHCASGVSPSFATTSGVTVTTGVWYRIDVKIDQTSGAKTADAYVDGVSVTQATSSDATAPAAVAITNGSVTISADYFIDDFVISSAGADYPIGAGYVNHFVPVSDGTHNVAVSGDFKKGDGTNISNATTDSYLLVDDTPLDDTTPDANDFIGHTVDTGGGSEYVEHVFGPASGISTPTVAPRAVETIVAYHQASTSAGDSTFKLNDNGTEDTILAFSGAGVTTIKYSRKHYADPPTGGSWTVVSGAGNFNNIRHRFGYAADASPDQYFDCAMVEAEFA